MDSGSTNFNDFLTTHHFCSGDLLTTVYLGKLKLIDCKKRTIVFEKGTSLKGEVIQRLAVYKNRRTKLFTSATHHNLRCDDNEPCFQLSLNEDDLHGLIKGVQSRRVRYRLDKYVFSPTITIVTKEATVVLMTTKSDYEGSMRQHALWYDCLKKKLHFGGYWSVQEETCEGESSSVTLCVSKYRLSVLDVSPDTDDDVFSVKAEYSVRNIVFWKLHFNDRQTHRVAYLSVTVAPDANSRRLVFRIDHDETMASDISDVLSRMISPPIQSAVRQQLSPAYLDLELRQSDDAAQLTTNCRRRGGGASGRAAVDKRRSRDDLDVDVRRRRECPPPPRGRPPETQLTSYDLNALSCTDSVKDAVHFYENVGCVSRQRTCRPPDVVSSHLDEDEEYWSIVLTLREVLRRKKPEPDTLGLTSSQRLRLCILLLDDSVPSWKNLADFIGLKQDAVKMIETLFRWNAGCDDVTPTECVLRHWQFVHNRWLVTGATPGCSTPSAPPCTLPSLCQILEQIGRHDLVVRLEACCTGPGDTGTALSRARGGSES